MSQPTHPDMFGDVSEFFMLAQPELEALPFGKFDKNTLNIGERIIDEEWQKEFWVTFQKIKTKGYSLELVSKLMDDAAGTIYVILWLCKGLDLPMNEYWKLVQEKNMAKFPTHVGCKGVGCNHAVIKTLTYENAEVRATEACMSGRLVLRNFETGKVMKPEGWTPPNHFKFLMDHWSEKTQRLIDKDAKDPYTKLQGFQQE